MWADNFKHLDGRGESFVAALDDLKNILGIFFEDLDRGAGDELDHVLVVALVPRDDRKDDDERVLLSDEVDVGYRRVVQESWVSVVTWEIMFALLEKNDECVWQGLETPSLLFKSHELDQWTLVEQLHVGLRPQKGVENNSKTDRPELKVRQ